MLLNILMNTSTSSHRYGWDLSRRAYPVNRKDQMMLLLNTLPSEFKNLNSIAGAINQDFNGVFSSVRNWN